VTEEVAVVALFTSALLAIATARDTHGGVADSGIALDVTALAIGQTGARAGGGRRHAREVDVVAEGVVGTEASITTRDEMIREARTQEQRERTQRTQTNSNAHPR
jgi:hypothetical protein